LITTERSRGISVYQHAAQLPLTNSGHHVPRERRLPVITRLLERSRIVAPPGWSRWLVPPAALSIHLPIGHAYARTLFKKPLEASLGVSGVASALPFTLGIVMLGASAALFGTKVDRNGPRWAMFVSMCCFCGGFLIASLGVAIRQYWLVVLGYGVVGGIGL